MSVNLSSPYTSISKLYKFLRAEEVSAFLEIHAFLVPVLIEAHDKIRNYFPASQLALEVFVDPESPADTHLTVWIGFEDDVDEAFNKLLKLEEEWIYYLQDEVVAKLSVNLGSR
ncbi:MAG: hypothetical protein WCS37_00355 [Chloroflexota bacterium]|nr:hypothetical protein [Chloroflexota bacterium]